MTKHEEILMYIRNLEVDTKVSVRSIASDLNVSEGTAYRAIKEAQASGIVNTIPRIGTIRVEKVCKRNIETLNFYEVANIVDGIVLGGKLGLNKPLNKFVIGAMTVDAMKKYISPGNLLIVGNREEAFKLALDNGSAVLITGGFGCSEEIKHYANDRKLPIISSSYDTFTIATMINKAISERLIKKDIILVEDIMNVNFVSTYITSSIQELRNLISKSGFSKFPVIDEKEKLVGVVTIKDITSDVKNEDMVKKVMTREPITVTQKTSVAHVAHIMVWDSLELIPVVEGKKIVGIISRSDVLKALQNVSRQPHVSETFEDMVIKNFQYRYVENGVQFSGKIRSEMQNPMGSASPDALTMLMSVVCSTALRHRNRSIFVDSFTIFHVKPIQIDENISVNAKIIGSSRNFAKVNVEMYDNSGELCSEGMMSAKVMKSK